MGSGPAQVLEPVVVDAEVVGHLVYHGDRHLVAEFVEEGIGHVPMAREAAEA